MLSEVVSPEMGMDVGRRGCTGTRGYGLQDGDEDVARPHAKRISICWVTKGLLGKLSGGCPSTSPRVETHTAIYLNIFR